MELVLTYSKTKKHKLKVKENGTEKEIEVPNSYLWLVFENGSKVLIQAVKDEDKRLLRSHARVQK